MICANSITKIDGNQKHDHNWKVSMFVIPTTLKQH